MILSLSDDPNVADWVSAVGQALGALFTAVAVGVALWVSHRDSRQRVKEEHAKSRAQAKLVLVDDPEVIDWEDQKEQGKVGRVFALGLLNISDRPILGAKFDALVVEGDEIRRLGSAPKTFLDPARQDVYEYLRIYAKKGVKISKWRVYWEDPDGLEWEVFWADGNKFLQPRAAKPWDDFTCVVTRDDR